MKPEFFTDWEKGVSGVVKPNGVRKNKNSFAMKLVALVEADSQTGYLASVKREFDKEERFENDLSIHAFIAQSCM